MTTIAPRSPESRRLVVLAPLTDEICTCTYLMRWAWAKVYRRHPAAYATTRVHRRR